MDSLALIYLYKFLSIDDHLSYRLRFFFFCLCSVSNNGRYSISIRAANKMHGWCSFDMCICVNANILLTVLVTFLTRERNSPFHSKEEESINFRVSSIILNWFCGILGNYILFFFFGLEKPQRLKSFVISLTYFHEQNVHPSHRIIFWKCWFMYIPATRKIRKQKVNKWENVFVIFFQIVLNCFNSIFSNLWRKQKHVHIFSGQEKTTSTKQSSFFPPLIFCLFWKNKTKPCWTN